MSIKVSTIQKTIPTITLTEHHNYAAFFLTFACNLRCDYCINWYACTRAIKQKERRLLTVEEWISAANRLALREDLPLTLQGGEPTLYKDFYKFVNNVREDIKMDLLTNMVFDIDMFIKNVPPWRFSRTAPYAPIRGSYHPGQNDIHDLINKTQKLQDAGFRVGLYGIMHPDEEIRKRVLAAKEICLKKGIDFRNKEFLGRFGGRVYGTYRYEGAVDSGRRYCDCKTAELIVDPAGFVYRCHSDLYCARKPIAHILDKDFNEEALEKFRGCFFYGECNPCDIKLKTNRFQIFGHTSVNIKNIRDLTQEEKISTKKLSTTEITSDG